MEISLEKVDQVKDRTASTYKEAKEALEMCNGDVLDAIIYIENKNSGECMESLINTKSEEVRSESIEDLKMWLKDLIRKGNISRIKVKKDDSVLVDVPVNAGIAATVIAVIIPPILAFGVITAIATKLTIEITKVDGTVEIVNKYVQKATNEIKEKTTGFADQIKNKIKESKGELGINKFGKEKVYVDNENTYSYTVNFDEKHEENN